MAGGLTGGSSSLAVAIKPMFLLPLLACGLGLQNWQARFISCFSSIVAQATTLNSIPLILIGLLGFTSTVRWSQVYVF